jgi:hexosaminidase
MPSRRTLLNAVLVLAAIAVPSPSPAQPLAPAGRNDLMPAPERLEWQTGHLILDARFSIASVGASDPRLVAARKRVQARLEAITGLRLLGGDKGGKNSTLLLDAAAPGLPVQDLTEDESYELAVTPRQARLTAPNPLGILRGLETFLQLIRPEGTRYVVPAVRIQDRPRFPWRGLLIDPCRRWQPLDVIKRNLDAMAAVKLNVLHWHLSEDQGFRIESLVFPRLNEKGSDGLYYTQQQVRDVLAYARDRGIRVMAEFDMPGHSTSWLVGHPELGSAPGPFSLERTWGVFDNALDPTRDEVYAFLDRFLGEMAALFPDAYLHIGGDEVTPRQWNENLGVLDFLYRRELDDAPQLQAHFNRRINEILTRHGKRMVGWDEILRPELPKSIVVQSWRGAQALAEAARLGYDGILSNGYYLDHQEPASFHYLNDPLPPSAGEERPHVLGGEACMWGEFVSPETIDSRLWPRTAAIAERLWSPAEVRDVEDMYRRLEIESVRLEATGVKHRSNYEPMLRGLVADHPIEPLRLLADLVEPVKGYHRGQLRTYTSGTPLDRLVDAARPESMPARRLRKEVDVFLRTPPPARDDRPLRAAFSTWRNNHPILEPLLSARGLEARPLSRDLAALGEVGEQALEAIRAGRQASESWLAEAQRVADRSQKPRAEVELAVVPAVRKLAVAAGQLDELKTLSLEEWNQKLDARLKPASDH